MTGLQFYKDSGLTILQDGSLLTFLQATDSSVPLTNKVLYLGDPDDTKAYADGTNPEVDFITVSITDPNMSDSFDPTGVVLANSEPELLGVAATGTITFHGTETNGDTAHIGAFTYTLVTGAEGSATDVHITGVATTDAQHFKSRVNAHSTDIVLSGSGAALTITAASVGTAGNALVLVVTGGHLTVSGATLSGGIDAATPGADLEVALEIDGGAGNAKPIWIRVLDEHTLDPGRYDLTINCSTVLGFGL